MRTFTRQVAQKDKVLTVQKEVKNEVSIIEKETTDMKAKVYDKPKRAEVYKLIHETINKEVRNLHDIMKNLIKEASKPESEKGVKGFLDLELESVHFH